MTFAWGIAQVLAMLCFVRIGVSLTYGILCSVGAIVGVVVPMIFKASGVFKDAPDLLSTPGKIILVGTAVMLVGVVFASLAGAGREKSVRKPLPRTSNAESTQSRRRQGIKRLCLLAGNGRSCRSVVDGMGFRFHV